jgi:hypothetical protein
VRLQLQFNELIKDAVIRQSDPGVTQLGAALQE